MPFHGKSFLRKQLLSHGTAGSFSEDRPEGGTLLPKAIGRAMEWPVSLAWEYPDTLLGNKSWLL